MKSRFYKIPKYILIGLLVLYSISNTGIAAINPETFILGDKVNGDPAFVYLMVWGMVGFVVSFLILKKPKVGLLFSVGYFTYFVLDNVLLNVNLPIFGTNEIYFFGLGLSVLVLILDKLYNKSKIN